MKTKEYINHLSVACLVGCGIAATFTSCRFEDEDYFDATAALRIEQTTEKVQNTLVAPANGWVMQYFTGTDEVEGFNLFARFENSQKVTLAGDHRFLRDGNAGKYTEHASLYEILKEDGPVLAFNTWNDVLTPFVDPVDYSAAPRALVKDGEGMGGDQNLVVLSYSDKEVLLRGERHGARVRMIPCETTWEEYIAATSNMKSYMTNSTILNYYVISEKDTLYFKNLRSGVITYCERIDDPLFPSTINCVFTPSGFRLHHENNIKGVHFQEFKMAADSTCLVSENDSVRVIPMWDDYMLIRSEVWNMNPDEFSAEQKDLFEQMDNAFNVYNKNASIASIGIGKSSGGNSVFGLVVTFYTNAAKTKTNTIGMTLDLSLVSMGQINISIPEEVVTDKNMDAVSTRVENMKDLALAFARTMAGVYNMTPDNYFLPTSCKFAPVGSGSAFTLSSK